MIIVNDKYAIRSDEIQWILCCAVTPSKTYPTGCTPRKFYGSLGGLRKALHGILLRTSDYSSLSDLEHNAHEISAMINARLEYGSREG
jgi:hypothetical protein